MAPVLARKQSADRSFERLYRKHAADVYRYALVVLRNESDAEDVTQTTFMNAYRAIERGERPQKPQNWLIAIAHNVCRQRFRQSQRRPNEVAYEDELAETIVDDDAITAEDIRRALGHLAFNQRAALVMRELEGRSYQEIAEILGLSLSAVETLLFRARRALREQLEEGITCHEAELSISKQLDDRLSRKEKGALRAHLRECGDCAGFARKQRAQRGALKALGAIPLPTSLVGLFGGGGGAAAGGAAFLSTGVVVKAAAFACGAIVATGVGYEGVKHTLNDGKAPAAASGAAKPKPTPTAAATAIATFTPAQQARNDEKPFRPKAVALRQAQKTHTKRAAATKASKPARGKSALAPGRERSHDLKPFKPTHVQRPHPTQPTHPQHPVRPTHPNTGGGHGQRGGTTKSKKPPATKPARGKSAR